METNTRPLPLVRAHICGVIRFLPSWVSSQIIGSNAGSGTNDGTPQIAFKRRQTRSADSLVLAPISNPRRGTLRRPVSLLDWLRPPIYPLAINHHSNNVMSDPISLPT